MSGEPPREDSVLDALFYPAERVKFVNWRQLSGAEPTVVLVGTITLVSFVSGLSTLSQQTIVLEGPLAGMVSNVETFVRFGGVLFAFILAPLTLGLRLKKRIAYYGTVLVLPFVAFIPLATLQTTEIPLLFLVILTLPLLIINRQTFDQSLGLSSLQIASLLSVFGVLLYGTAGSYGLRNQFVDLETWGDAVYYVIVTIATVGYGDITPTTTEAKWFSLSIILLGTGAFTAAIGSLIVPAIEKRMATAFGKMKPSELRLMENHVIVLGYGDITEPLLDELDEHTDIVVVTPDSDIASDIDDENVEVVTDDPTDEAVLHDVNIGGSRGIVVGTRNDANDVLAVLAAREANPDTKIVAAANDRKHINKLETVGADEVVSPVEMGGRLLGKSVLGDRSMDSFLETDDDRSITSAE